MGESCGIQQDKAPGITKEGSRNDRDFRRSCREAEGACETTSGKGSPTNDEKDHMLQSMFGPDEVSDEIFGKNRSRRLEGSPVPKKERETVFVKRMKQRFIEEGEQMIMHARSRSGSRARSRSRASPSSRQGSSEFEAIMNPMVGAPVRRYSSSKKRFDGASGWAYDRNEFKKYYGQFWEEKWNLARPEPPRMPETQNPFAPPPLPRPPALPGPPSARTGSRVGRSQRSSFKHKGDKTHEAQRKRASLQSPQVKRRPSSVFAPSPVNARRRPVSSYHGKKQQC